MSFMMDRYIGMSYTMFLQFVNNLWHYYSYDTQQVAGLCRIMVILSIKRNLVKILFKVHFFSESQNSYNTCNEIFKKSNGRFHSLKTTFPVTHILYSLTFLNWMKIIHLICEKEPAMFLESKFTGMYTSRCLRGENNPLFTSGRTERETILSWEREQRPLRNMADFATWIIEYTMIYNLYHIVYYA